MYDVVIAGASFAGLAAAQRLSGLNVLVMDRKPIGAGQTSACALPESWVKRYGATESIMQRHEHVHLHVGRKVFSGDLAWEPYVTVDYSRFCQSLADKCDYSFRQERVIGVIGNNIYTSSRAYRGKELLDCTGWRRALSERAPSNLSRPNVNYGLEVEVKMTAHDLHFFWEDCLPTGMGWLFPAGSVSRIGVGEYRGRTDLQPALARLVARLAPGREITAVHAGYFPHRLADPVQNGIWQAGDAAGQCYAFSGEGIRPALYFGDAAGRLISAAITGQISKGEAEASYRRVLDAASTSFCAMNLAQSLHLVLPSWGKTLIWAVLAKSGMMDLWFQWYQRQTANSIQELPGVSAKVNPSKTGFIG